MAAASAGSTTSIGTTQLTTSPPPAGCSRGSSVRSGTAVRSMWPARRNITRMIGERHRDLGGGDGDDEEGQDRPCRERRPRAAARRDEQEVGGVEDELDADEDEDGVAPREDAVDPDAGEQGGEGGREREVDHPRPLGAEADAAADCRRCRRRLRRRDGRRVPVAVRLQDEARHREGADERDEEQHREQLEGPDPGAEDRLGHLRAWSSSGCRGRPSHRRRGAAAATPAAPSSRPRAPRRRSAASAACRSRRGDRSGRGSSIRREEHEHDDGADVDEQLDQADELLAEHEVDAGQRAERDEQPQGGVDDVLRRHRQQGRECGDGTDSDEDDVAGGHSRSCSSVDTVGSTCVESPCAAAWSAACSASAPSAGGRGDVCSTAGMTRVGSVVAGVAGVDSLRTRVGRAAAPGRTRTTGSAGAPGGPRCCGHLGGVGAAGVERGRRRDGGHPRPEPVLLVEQVADVELGVLELGAPVQGVERAHLDADAAVHAEREVDGEAVEDVALAGPAARRRRRQLLLVRVDVDAPVGALTRAEHARGAVLLGERDDASRPWRERRRDVGVLGRVRVPRQRPRRRREPLDEPGEYAVTHVRSPPPPLALPPSKGHVWPRPHRREATAGGHTWPLDG